MDLTPEEHEHREVLGLLLVAMRYCVSDRFRLRTTSFARGPHKLMIADLLVYGGFPRDLDPGSSVAARIGCTHPYFDRRGVHALLATSPGVTCVEENNYYQGEKNHPLWTRFSDRGKPPHSFGFLFLLDLTDRATHLRELEARIYGEARQ